MSDQMNTETCTSNGGQHQEQLVTMATEQDHIKITPTSIHAQSHSRQPSYNIRPTCKLLLISASMCTRLTIHNNREEDRPDRINCPSLILTKPFTFVSLMESVPNRVAVSGSLQHRHDQLRHDANECELFGIKRSRSARRNNLSMTISTTNTRDDTDTVNDILSKDSTGIRNELWKSATETDNNGPIKAVDYYLCSYSVVHMTSRNDAASKKLLNDIINHGEF